ncbi:hypothetical protein [Streptomyces sp. OE57]|uniref:hypothetical protein n=1 Tax=Streptomyces lacaronensis TaxID=3379885 RepID=UPI0039B77A4C
MFFLPRPHTPGPEAEPLLVEAETDLRPTLEVTAARRTLRAHPALVLIGIVLASLNMRAALADVSPLLGEISGHFGPSATTGSLVTTIPLIFMGLASPFAPRFARRWGTEAVLLSALVLLLGGILLRVAPPVMAVFAGGRPRRQRDRVPQCADAGPGQAGLPAPGRRDDRALHHLDDRRGDGLRRLRRAPGERARRLAGFARLVVAWGYLLAAVGPLALGVVHRITGGWALPLTLMLAVCGALAVLGLGPGRDRRIRS